MGLAADISSLSKVPPFCPTGVTLPDVSKTGLGSSAALITSLVTALLVQFAVIPSTALSAAHNSAEALSFKQYAHNVSQFVHCLAQGKVGSGFDVSSAVFGSQIYTRFSPVVIQSLMEDTVGSSHHTVHTSPRSDHSCRAFAYISRQVANCFRRRCLLPIQPGTTRYSHSNFPPILDSFWQTFMPEVTLRCW